jgi:glutaredoxin
MSTSNITIYSKPNCQFCDKSKYLIKTLGFQYEEKMFGKDFKTPDELFEAVGKQVRTMPQIIIDDKHIGGYNELVEYFADKGLCNFKGEVTK